MTQPFLSELNSKQINLPRLYFGNPRGSGRDVFASSLNKGTSEKIKALVSQYINFGSIESQAVFWERTQVFETVGSFVVPKSDGLQVALLLARFEKLPAGIGDKRGADSLQVIPVNAEDAAGLGALIPVVWAKMQPYMQERPHGAVKPISVEVDLELQKQAVHESLELFQHWFPGEEGLTRAIELLTLWLNKSGSVQIQGFNNADLNTRIQFAQALVALLPPAIRPWMSIAVQVVEPSSAAFFNCLRSDVSASNTRTGSIYDVSKRELRNNQASENTPSFLKYLESLYQKSPDDLETFILESNNHAAKLICHYLDPFSALRDYVFYVAVNRNWKAAKDTPTQIDADKLLFVLEKNPVLEQSDIESLLEQVLRALFAQAEEEADLAEALGEGGYASLVRRCTAITSKHLDATPKLLESLLDCELSTISSSKLPTCIYVQEHRRSTKTEEVERAQNLFQSADSVISKDASAWKCILRDQVHLAGKQRFKEEHLDALLRKLLEQYTANEIADSVLCFTDQPNTPLKAALDVVSAPDRSIVEWLRAAELDEQLVTSFAVKLALAKWKVIGNQTEVAFVFDEATLGILCTDASVTSESNTIEFFGDKQLDDLQIRNAKAALLEQITIQITERRIKATSSYLVMLDWIMPMCALPNIDRDFTECALALLKEKDLHEDAKCREFAEYLYKLEDKHIAQSLPIINIAVRLLQEAHPSSQSSFFVLFHILNLNPDWSKWNACKYPVELVFRALSGGEPDTSLSYEGLDSYGVIPPLLKWANAQEDRQYVSSLVSAWGDAFGQLLSHACKHINDEVQATDYIKQNLQLVTSLLNELKSSEKGTEELYQAIDHHVKTVFSKQPDAVLRAFTAASNGIELLQPIYKLARQHYLNNLVVPNGDIKALHQHLIRANALFAPILRLEREGLLEDKEFLISFQNEYFPEMIKLLGEDKQAFQRDLISFVNALREIADAFAIRETRGLLGLGGSEAAAKQLRENPDKRPPKTAGGLFYWLAGLILRDRSDGKAKRY